MTTKIRRNKGIKKTAIALIIILALSAIIVIGIYQNQPRVKKSAAEYFLISHARLLDSEYKEPSVTEGGGANKSSILIVYGVSYRLHARGGDAHLVIVEGWANSNSTLFEYILKDEFAIVYQWSFRPFGLKISRNEEGKFPFQAEIDSTEAKGTITIDFY